MSRIFLMLYSICVILACNRTEITIEPGQAPFLNIDSNWADSMMLELTLEEKIGQLFVLRPDSVVQLKDSILGWGSTGKLGGIILENVDLDTFAHLVDTLQQLSRVPILNGTNQSIVLNNQFTDVTHFPLPATFSAIQKDSIYLQLLDLYVRQCQTLNIHFSLSPVLNQNQLSDSIYNFQYYQSDSLQILRRAMATLSSLHHNRLLSVAQSFKDLVFIENDTLPILDSLLLKYKLLTQNGLSGILTSRQIYKQHEVEKMRSTFLRAYLKRQVGFDGLIFGEINAETKLENLLHAGTDIFIVEKDVSAHIDTIKNMLALGLLNAKALNHKVYKILMAKSWVGLDRICEQIYAPQARHTMEQDQFDYYIRSLFERSITLAWNYNDLLPFTGTYKRNFRLVQIGKTQLNTFKSYFEKYADFRPFHYRPKENGILTPLERRKFRTATVVITLDNQNLQKEKDSVFILSVNELSQKEKVVLINFGNPLNLQYFDTTLTAIQIFERNKITESLAAQLLFGSIQANGRLPLKIAKHLPSQAQTLTPVTRLKYTVPQDVGIAPHKLVGIDAIMGNSILSGATPGGQILLVKDGKIFYHKSFGWHSFEKKQEVQENDLYDIASITKIAATNLAVMKLYDQKRIELKDKIKQHLECSETSTIKNITLNKLLIHQSRLQSNMPIAPYVLYRDTSGADCNKYYCNHPYGDFNIQVADSLFMDRRWIDSIWAKVDHLPIQRRKRFNYSDVNFNLLKRIVEQKEGEKLDDYLNKTFYYPLNLRHCTYNPLARFRKDQIVPTAYEETWRKQLIDGFVHDESAALLGGVGGSAGLFSNANDLAVLFQMILNGGTYGGKDYLSPETIRFFTSNKHGNHRGLGFDRNTNRRARTCSGKAPATTYGHTGFTGTCVWVDPENEIIFIFLANRIHPSVKNKRLFRLNTRSRIHNVLYDALGTYEDKLFPKTKKSMVRLADIGIDE